MPHVDHPLGWPSVTEVLRDYAMGWYKFFVKKYGTVEAAEAYGKERAEVGTRMHEALEMWFKSSTQSDANLNTMERRALNELVRVIENLGVELVGSEREVQSKIHKYHGSLDGLVKVNNPSVLPNEDFLGNPVAVNPGVLTIMDLKTKENDKPLMSSEMRKHSMQMAAYGQAIQEEDGTQPELGLIIQLDIPTAKVTLHCAYPLQKFFKPFHLQRQMFDYINGKEEWESKRKRGRK